LDGLEESDLGELDDMLATLFFNTQWVNFCNRNWCWCRLSLFWLGKTPSRTIHTIPAN
jgi:hypothetical protein